MVGWVQNDCKCICCLVVYSHDCMAYWELQLAAIATHYKESMVPFITSLAKRSKFEDEIQFLLNPYDFCSVATSANHSQPIIHLEPSVLYSIPLSYLPGGSSSCVLVPLLNSRSHYFFHQPLISVMSLRILRFNFLLISCVAF